jgi:hypothetical protein
MSTAPFHTGPLAQRTAEFQYTTFNQPVGRTGIIGLAVFFVVVAVVTVVFLVGLWPAPDPKAPQTPFYLLLLPDLALNPPSDVRIALVALLGGVLGSLIHATASFTSYVGTTAGPLMGALERAPSDLTHAARAPDLLPEPGRILSTRRPGDVISPYRVAGICGLVGMLSKQATPKLKEVFDDLFNPKEDARRLDKLAADPR